MFEGPVQRLIEELGSLPGIGAKSAQRLAFHLLGEQTERVERLAAAILAVAETMKVCERCFNVSEKDYCRICSDTRRDRTSLCIVAEPRDIQAIEDTGEFNGIYHVLGGLLIPINGITPDKLHIQPLLHRVVTEQFGEALIALSNTVDGETTASYLRSKLGEANPQLPVTKIASGMPSGGDLSYADKITLGSAIAGRTSL